MKIVYLTDTHDQGRNPGGRIDNYHAAILKKMNEAFDYAIANDADAIVHGGDWFDTPKVSNIIYNQHQRMLRKARKAGIPVYVVPGNHDLFGYNIDTIEQTSIGSFANAGLVKLLTTSKSIVLKEGTLAVGIHGREYFMDIDKDPANDYQIRRRKGTKVNLLFSHGMLLQKPFHPDVRHSLTKDIITKADYVFNGHYHPGYPMHDVNGVTFVNIGSTARDEASVGNMTRQVQFAEILVSPKGAVKVNLIPYKCAKPAADVLDRSRLNEKKQVTNQLNDFKSKLEGALDFDAFDPKDILQKSAGKGISGKVMKEALEAIVKFEEAEQNNKFDGYQVSKRSVSLVSAEITNFESHVKTVVDFDKNGVNAITGATDSGKSSIFRAIRFAVHNEPKGAAFIRKGATRASVKLNFSNGQSIERSRTKSSAGEYVVYDKNGNKKELKGFGTDIPIEVMNVHQMPKVEIAPGVERALNIAHQLDGHFMLSESPLTRAAVIGRLTGVHLVDAAIKEKAKDLRAITIDTNASEKRIEELEEQVKSYDYLQEKEQRVMAIKGYLQGVELNEKKLEQLQQDKEEYEELAEQIDDYLDTLDSMRFIDEGTEKLRALEDMNKQLDGLLKLADDLRHIDSEITRIESSTQDIDFDAAEAKIAEIDAASKRLALLNDYEVSLANVEQNIGKLESKLISLSPPAVEGKLLWLDEAAAKLKLMMDLLSAYDAEETEIFRYEESNSSIEEEIGSIEEKIRKTLSTMDNKCPLCMQEITDSTVEGMLAHF